MTKNELIEARSISETGRLNALAEVAEAVRLLRGWRFSPWPMTRQERVNFHYETDAFLARHPEPGGEG